MDTDRLINRMDCFRHLINALKDSIPVEDAHWKPNKNDWSIIEIISHMVDTETHDMRVRLRLTLEDPTQDWPPIDPEGWAISRKYAENDLTQVVDQFLVEREASINWLRSLGDTDWSISHHHQKFGSMQAGEILAAWCSHDALHLRQIAKRVYQLTQCDAAPFHSNYAGEWKA